MPRRIYNRHQLHGPRRVDAVVSVVGVQRQLRAGLQVSVPDLRQPEPRARRPGLRGARQRADLLHTQPAVFGAPPVAPGRRLERLGPLGGLLGLLRRRLQGSEEEV